MQKSSSFIFATSIEPVIEHQYAGEMSLEKQQRSGKYMCRTHMCDTTRKKTCHVMVKCWECLRKRGGWACERSWHVRQTPLLAAVGLGLASHTHMTAVQLGPSSVLPWELLSHSYAHLQPHLQSFLENSPVYTPTKRVRAHLARLKFCLSGG